MALTPRQREILFEIFDYIENEFSARMSIAAIAKKHGMSQSTLIRAYKELYKITPSEQRKLAIVRYAVKRAAEGAQPKVIAIELGYDNYSNFMRMLRRKKNGNL